MEMSRYSSIEFSGTIRKEGERFIAYCSQLPMSAFGSTEQEAGENIINALGLYMQTHADLGQLSEILKRYNLVPKVDYKVANQRFEAKCPIPV